MYFEPSVFTPSEWSPSHQFIANAGTMFLASYAALTHVAGPCRAAHMGIWTAFSFFTLYYMNYPCTFFRISNLMACALVLGSLNRQ